MSPKRIPLKGVANIFEQDLRGAYPSRAEDGNLKTLGEER
jgi:hypothetical protein